MTRVLQSYQETTPAGEERRDQWLEERRERALTPEQPEQPRERLMDPNQMEEQLPPGISRGGLRIATGVAKGLLNAADALGGWSPAIAEGIDDIEYTFGLDIEPQSGMGRIVETMAQVILAMKTGGAAGRGLVAKAATKLPEKAAKAAKAATKPRAKGEKRLTGVNALRAAGAAANLAVVNYVVLNPEESQPLIDMFGQALAEYADRNPSEAVPMWEYIDGKADTTRDREFEQRTQNVVTDVAGTAAFMGLGAVAGATAGRIPVGRAIGLMMNDFLKINRALSDNPHTRRLLREAYDKASEEKGWRAFEDESLLSTNLPDVEAERLGLGGDRVLPMTDETYRAKMGHLPRFLREGAEAGEVEARTIV